MRKDGKHSDMRRICAAACSKSFKEEVRRIKRQERYERQKFQILEKSLLKERCVAVCVDPKLNVIND